MSKPLIPGDPMTEAHKQQLLKAILQKLSPQDEKPIVEYRVSLDQSIETAIRRLIDTQASAEAILKSISDRAKVMETSLGKLDASSKQILSLHDDKLRGSERSLNAANTALDGLLSKSSIKAAALESMVTNLQDACLRLTETVAATTNIVAESGANTGGAHGRTQNMTDDKATSPHAASTATTGTDSTPPGRWRFFQTPFSTKHALGGLLALVVGIALAAILVGMPPKPDPEKTSSSASDAAAPDSEQASGRIVEFLEDCAEAVETRDPSCERLADDFDKAFSIDMYCKNSKEESAVFCRLAKSLPKANNNAQNDGYHYSALCAVAAKSDSENCKRGMYQIEKRMRETASTGSGGSGPV
jgi:hypothetical protein